MKYRTEIDGLRALAVLPVIFFHAKIPFFDGGFVGVDIFFVISGYLISSIIMDELDKGIFSLASFYERRARRILPALFFVIFVSILLAFFLLLPRSLEQFSKSASATFFFVSNFFFADKVNYFTDTDFIPLLHTWSLAVEEQFYLFFPLCLMLLWRFGRAAVFYILLLLFIISLGLAQWSSEHDPTSGFYLLHTRIWELLAGVFASFYFRYSKFIFPQAVKQIASIFGLLLIVLSIFFLDKAFAYPSLFTLFPVVGALLIILFAKDKGVVNYLLSLKPLVGIGLLSYSAYLWHQPILAFVRHGSPKEISIFGAFILCIITFLFAYISWRFIEKPFRYKISTGIFTISRVRMMTYLSSFAGIMLLFTAYSDLSEGIEWRPDSLILTAHGDISEQTNARPSVPVDCIDNNNDPSSTIFIAECQKKRDIVLWGNSHAESLNVGIFKKFDSAYFPSKCGAALDVGVNKYKFKECVEFWKDVPNKDADIVKQIPKLDPRIIILHSHWKIIPTDFLIPGISETLDVLLETTSARIILLGGIHVWDNKFYSRLFKNFNFEEAEGFVYKKIDTSKVRMYDSLIREVIDEKANDRINFISALDILCKDDSECILLLDDDGRAAPIFYDGNHFTEVGSDFFTEKLSPYLE